MTGLVSPSRSTIGNISFCTAVEAGYCRVPRPAAVMTALRTLAILGLLRRFHSLGIKPRGASNTALSFTTNHRQGTNDIRHGPRTTLQAAGRFQNRNAKLGLRRHGHAIWEIPSAGGGGDD